MDEKAEGIRQKFIERFKVEPILTKAPGRINFIGEHTDYNDGFVLPAAIDRSCQVAISLSGSHKCTMVALDLAEEYEFDLNDEWKPSEVGWVNYFLGVTYGINESGGKLNGFNMMFTSNIPLGGGLSSSAALESAFGVALNELIKAGLSKIELAKIGQSAEHNFVGVKCGLMDQFASCMGLKNHAILLDCRSLEHKYYQIDFPDHEIILFDSQVKHNLASSEYNVRREQCERGVKEMRKNNPKINSLREATLEDLESVRNNLDKVVFNRCKYVIEEIQRVLNACEALENNDWNRFGDLMNRTHEGLRDLYEVSCEELDYLFECAMNEPGVIGSRMMGGGFGGCTINVVEKTKSTEIIARISGSYETKFGKAAKTYRFSISDGASILTGLK